MGGPPKNKKTRKNFLPHSNNKLLIGLALSIIVPKDENEKSEEENFKGGFGGVWKFTIEVLLNVNEKEKASHGNRYGDWDRTSFVKQNLERNKQTFSNKDEQLFLCQ